MKEKAYRPMNTGELMKEFDVEFGEYQIFQEILDSLEQEGKIHKTKKERYGVPERLNLAVGVLQGNPRGFAFLIPDAEDAEDVYISLEKMNGAMHQDRVKVRLLKSSYLDKAEGEVVQILKRAHKTIVGRVEKARRVIFVIPDEKRIFHYIFIADDNKMSIKEGDKVLVKITKWPHKKRGPEGKIVEILGDASTPGIDMISLMHRLNLPREFPAGVLDYSAKIKEEIPERELQNRLDLREKLIFTIDGADAKDFDDAISLEMQNEKTVCLGVHIADVSHYVQESDILDQEAFERGNSVYLVDRVIPMLPEKLSNQLCSLQEGVDRLTISLLMDIDWETGKVLKADFQESVINSKKRLTYDEVNQVLKNESSIAKELDQKLLTMNRLAQLLKKNKEEGGSIDFDFPEAQVELAEDGTPLAITKRVRDQGEMLIEEFMILANSITAKEFAQRKIPFIYRVHEAPDLLDLKLLNEFLHNYGYHIRENEGEIDPKAYQNVIEKVKGTPEEKSIQRVILRSLKQARYSVENFGHFGLALKFYTHFTSPIRRYSDLIVHRLLKEKMNQKKFTSSRKDELNNSLPEIARNCSSLERKAMEAERESVDLKMVEFMEKRIGETYQGVISSVTAFGFFVELDFLVEGLVHVSTLVDDYYHFQEGMHLLIGEQTRKVYRLGDQVQVVVNRVSRELNQIDFLISD